VTLIASPNWWVRRGGILAQQEVFWQAFYARAQGGAVKNERCQASIFDKNMTQMLYRARTRDAFCCLFLPL
jgi:hypothetical protein